MEGEARRHERQLVDLAAVLHLEGLELEGVGRHVGLPHLETIGGGRAAGTDAQEELAVIGAPLGGELDEGDGVLVDLRDDGLDLADEGLDVGVFSHVFDDERLVVGDVDDAAVDPELRFSAGHFSKEKFCVAVLAIVCNINPQNSSF